MTGRKPQKIEGHNNTNVATSLDGIKLNNILYVTFVCNCLILVERLKNIENIIVFTKYYCWILDNIKNKKIIAIRHTDSKSHFYKFKNLIFKMNSMIRKSNLYLGHHKLRHLHYYGSVSYQD